MTTRLKEAEKQPTEKRFYPIEPSTGLPFLPGGYWWEVEQIDSSSRYYNGTRRYQLHIKHRTTVGECFRIVEPTFWEKLTGRTPAPLVEPAYEREVSEVVLNFYNEETGKLLEYITPNDISYLAQNAAHVLYERKRTEALAKESEKLIGKYPPLSVNAL